MAKILLIDDDATFSALVADWLDMGGHTVTLASNGKVAKAALQKETPDLVISDLYMPEMDGMEFLRSMRDVPHSFPIIMISGDAVQGRTPMLAVCEHLGANAVLRKPFSQGELLSHVSNLLQQKQ